ncbi:TetR/AcrR family transcriptional regulator [Reichenbachiella versicolor]|uniref:TetR/AcrR family transcriptional regulator n=1 Tax=Reichenbachiella versicolor TaxID=1821036 RepID=UPI000D6E88C3|nr:TetR/AcrR family transcriptional regulator [Reichenbachiella versicolor]
MPKVETFDREKVMDKIMLQFWEHGFHGTSMQDIVDVSGLNRSSIYNSFGDKFKLYLESLKHYRKTLQTPTFKQLIQLSPKQAIRVFYEDVIKCIEDKTNDRGCLITNCTTELIHQNGDIDAYVSESVHDTKEFFKELILIGIESGEFDKGINIEQTVLYLYSNLLGLRVTAMQIEDKKALQSIINKALENI